MVNTFISLFSHPLPVASVHLYRTLLLKAQRTKASMRSLPVSGDQFHGTQVADSRLFGTMHLYPSQSVKKRNPEKNLIQIFTVLRIKNPMATNLKWFYKILLKIQMLLPSFFSHTFQKDHIGNVVHSILSPTAIPPNFPSPHQSHNMTLNEINFLLVMALCNCSLTKIFFHVSELSAYY